MSHPFPNGPEHRPPYAAGGPVVAPPAPRKRRTGLIVGIVIAAVFLVCGGIGLAALVAGGNAVDDAIDEINASASADAAGERTPAATAPAAKPAAGKPATRIAGDGTYEVGRDIAAARYHTTGPRESVINVCTWSITSKAGETIDAGVTQGAAYMPPAAGRKLTAGQVVQVSGCREWTLA